MPTINYETEIIPQTPFISNNANDRFDITGTQGKYITVNNIL